MLLNVGCGLNAPDGWVNIDLSWAAWLAKHPYLKKWLYHLKIISEKVYQTPWPSNILIHDITKGLPCSDNAAEGIFASHLLEHLTRSQAKEFIEEAYRVLAPGGVIRLIAPDLEQFAETYLTEVHSESVGIGAELPGDRFLRNLAFSSTNAERSPIERFAQVCQDKNTHKWMYDALMLEKLLCGQGFVEVRQCGQGDSKIRNIGDVEKPERFKNSICFEGVKQRL